MHVRMNRKKSVEKRPMVCNLRLQSKDVRSRKQGLDLAALRLACQASQGLLHRDVYSALEMVIQRDFTLQPRTTSCTSW